MLIENFKKITANPITQYLVLMGLVFIIVFLKIGSFHMRFWDESIFAVNTYEMMGNGKYFSMYFEGEPDLYNTKPPLMNWLQICFSKLFGYNELSMRLPSAISAGLAILMVFRFSRKHLGILWAWSSSLILLSTKGFIGYHTARTGDSDALLSFFILMTAICFFEYILSDKRKYILYIFLFLILGFATKLYAVFLFLPGFLIILIYKKKLKDFIFNLQFLIGIVAFICLISGMIYLRELETPSYIETIFYNDARRLFTALSEHSKSRFFFLDNLYTERFSWWIIPFAFGVSAFLFKKDIPFREILSYILICISSYFLIITFSATKLIWYDMPLYPLMAIISAYPLVLVIRNLQGEEGNRSLKIIGTIALFFFYPLFLMFRQSQDNSVYIGDRVVEANEIYLFESYDQDKDLNNIKVYYNGWNGSLLFYKYKYQEKGQYIELSRDTIDFQVGDRILVCKDTLKEVMNANYTTECIDRFDTAELLLIK